MAKKTINTKNTKAVPKKAPAKAKAAPKAPKAPKVEHKALPRHPKARVTAAHESKEALAKSLSVALAKSGESAGDLADKLKTASNQQLLRLHGVVEQVKAKYGDREKLIAKLGEFEKKAKDKDYLAKLGALGLPQLLELAAAHERRARA